MAVLDIFSPMFVAEFVMLTAVLFVGIYSSYTDIRGQRIPNRLTFGLLAFGLCGQLYFLYLGHTNFDQVVTLFSVSFILSVVLFVSGLWAAGDAKLYWASAVALPPTLFSTRAISSLNYSAWALAINAVLLSAIFLFVSLAVSGSPEIPGYRGKGPMKLYRRGLEITGTTGLTLGLAGLVYKVQPSVVELAAATVIFYRAIDHFLPPRVNVRIPAILFPGLGALAFVSESLSVLQSAALVWALAWGAESVYVFLRNRYADVLVRLQPIIQLREGMTPHEHIYKLGADESGAVKYIRIAAKVEGGEALCKAGKALSRTQAGTLRSLSKSGVFKCFNDEIIVAKDIPYAPFLLLAVCVTVFASGTILFFVAERLRPAMGSLGPFEFVVADILKPFTNLGGI